MRESCRESIGGLCGGTKDFIGRQVAAAKPFFV
jgi:hypothetical protein